MSPGGDGTRTAVVADSTARLGGGPSLLGARGPAFVELDVVVDGEPVAERHLTTAALLAHLAAGRRVTTSRPAPAGVGSVYDEQAARGASGVVSVHLSRHLSGTVEAASLAARAAPVRVEVVDTQTVGGAHALAVTAALALAEAGADVRRTAAVARGVADASATWVSPASPVRLLEGGRAGAAAGAVAALAAAARPVLEVQGGRLVPVERTRTTARLAERLAALAEEHVDHLRRGGHGAGPVAPGPLPPAVRAVARSEGVRLDVPAVVVQHVGAADLAATVARAVTERVGGRPEGSGGPAVDDRPLVVVRELGAVLGAHVGPGAVGVAVAPWARRGHRDG